MQYPGSTGTPAFSSPPAPIRRWPRVLLKLFLFLTVSVLILNPNLRRAVLQVRHTLHPNALIQTRFPDIMRINAQVDRWVAADHGRHSEARLVARFVVRQIAYVSDYENWGNLEYWPTAEETWQKGQEDCDGRAILATSILRSRGFHSARLIVGLDHMWIKVDENEKDDSKAPHYVALLNPDPNFSLDLPDRPDSRDLFRLVRAFLHPTALRETSTHFFADIPLLRKVLLISFALLLCCHPFRRSAALLVVFALGLLAVAVLADWDPDQGNLLQASVGGGLIVCAFVLALLLGRIHRYFPRQGDRSQHPPPTNLLSTASPDGAS